MNMFVFVILAGLKGCIIEMFQNNRFYHNVAFFLGLGGSREAVTHSLVRCLGGEHLLLARPAEATPVLYCTIHPWLSNRSASLRCAIRHELVVVDVVLLEGWFQFFFLGVFFLWRFGCGDVGSTPPED